MFTFFFPSGAVNKRRYHRRPMSLPITIGSMVRIARVAVVAAASAACSTPGVDAPVSVFQASVAYTSAAACIFGILDKRYPTFVRYEDIRGANAIRISYAFQSTGISARPWIITITPAAPNRARIESSEGAIFKTDMRSILAPCIDP
jgi:hypothetical protein